MVEPDQVVIAKAIATIAHRGQVDKAGVPYIEHPARVVALLESPTNRAVAAAWLHDVLEDTDITAEDLTAAGVSHEVVYDVALLTRTKEQSSEDYYEALRHARHARHVKLADIADNTNPNRLALLDDATIARLTRK